MTLRKTRIGLAILTAFAGLLLPSPGRAQPPQPRPQPPTAVEPPDAQRIEADLSNLLNRYPPKLRPLLRLDPSLLSNPAFLASYPALANFVNAHPEVARDPTFYLGDEPQFETQRKGLSQEMLDSLGVFAGFGMAIWLLTWLIRTFMDYRRWTRLAKVQSEVHAKLMDRFTANEDLLAYIQSPAGSKFLESSPIALDTGPRSVAAPMGRILWSLQAGVVIFAAGIGLYFVSARVPRDVEQAMRVLGALGIALGFGFVLSAGVSYLLSRKLGLIEPPAK